MYRQMLQSAAWTVLMRWSMRLVGIVSTVILARLLTPADFGLVAMGTLFIGMMANFADLGVSAHLIRKQGATPAHFDTGWTLGLAQQALVAAIMYAGAPLWAAYFREPRLEEVVRVMALAALAAGLENIGMTMARKELQFALDFRFNVAKRLAVFFVTVGCAWTLRSYWALVYGYVFGTLAGVVLSYAMHPFRPQPRLVHAREFLVFAASIIPISIGRFLRDKVDLFVVGRIASTADVGRYSMAADLASTFNDEIVAPLGRALGPNYAKLRGQPDRLAEAFVNVFGAIALVCIPIGFGLSAIAEPLVVALLGEKWRSTHVLMSWLVFYSTARTMNRALTGNILITIGRERRTLLSTWVELGFATAAAAYGAWQGGVVGVAKALTWAGLVTTPFAIHLLTTAMPVRHLEIIARLWRPLAGAVLMFLCLRPLVATLAGHEVHEILQLAAAGSAGAAIYAACVVALWFASGRPPGVESMLAGKLRARLGRG